ncbi:MAG: WD40 repeat domain-containing protein [Gemmataceae bacterium]|nr:WD40 repeat domain-containing protein [Gemmataceae bacterium]
MHRPFSLPGYVLLAGLAALASLSITGPQDAAQPASRRLPVPDASAQGRAEAIVRKLFKEDYARSEKDVSAARELATTLLKQAQGITDSTPLRFVALREARDLAARAGDVSLTFQAIAALAKEFALDGLAMKIDTLAGMGGKSTSTDTHKAVAEAALTLIDEAVVADAREAVVRLLTLAEERAALARSLPLVARVQKRTTELQALRKQLEALKPALDKLRVAPKDPDANLAVGRYHALGRGDWARGLPLLALGADAALREAARLDLANPAQAQERASAGDAWWVLAEKSEGQTRDRLKARAFHWYRQAVAGLEGESKARVEKRLAEAGPVPGPVRVFTGHTRPVHSAALSPDGKLAVSGGDDDDLRLWDVATGKPLRVLKGHTNLVWSVAFAPDGKHVLSAGDDRTVRLWDVTAGTEVRRFAGHTDSVTRAAFSPDGRQAVTASDDKTLRLWQVATGKEVHRFEGHQKAVVAAAFTTDGARIVSGGKDRTLGVWDAVTGKELRTLEGHADTVWGVAFALDGKHLLSGSGDRTVRLWEIADAREVRRFEGHTGQVLSVAISPDGKRALSAGEDQVIRLWDVASGKELYRLEGHTDEVWSVTFSADGRYCLSASADRTVRLWGLPR